MYIHVYIGFTITNGGLWFGIISRFFFRFFFNNIILYCLTRLLTKHLRCPGKQKYGMSLSKFIKFLNELKAFDNKSYNVIHHFNVVKYLPLMITIQNFWGKQNRWYVCSRYFIPGDMHATDISYQVIHVHVYHAFVPYTCRYMYHIECNFKLKRLCDKSPSIFLGFLTSLTSAMNPTNITISRNIKSGTRRYPATVAMCRISTHQTGIDRYLK